MSPVCLLSPSGHLQTDRTCEGLGACRRRSAAAVFGQLEALHSTWSARAQSDMWVNHLQSRDPLAQRGRKRGLSSDMLRPSGHEPSG